MEKDTSEAKLYEFEILKYSEKNFEDEMLWNLLKIRHINH